ncbi:MAG: Maf family protein [Acidobacteriota bacterium]
MSASPRLVLASASPRRRDLLARCGVPFTVRPSRVGETRRPGEAPVARTVRLAREKAESVASRLRSPAWVMGSDTAVVVDGEILDKPGDDATAAGMLRRLSGRWHEVLSAVVLVAAHLPRRRPGHGWRRTRVHFRRLSAAQIAWLLAAGEHRDKAGGYALQGRAGAFIAEISGSASNVVGLPLDLVMELLRRRRFLPFT